MQKIRTTITLPEDFHEELMLMSLKTKKSLGQLVFEKFKNKQYLIDKNDIQEKLSRDARFFSKLSRKLKGKKINWALEVRKQRDTRTKNLLNLMRNG